MSKPALIGLDWGTTALRAYLLDAEGTIMARHHSQDGAGQVEPGAYPAVLERALASWLEAHRELPILASGMVGSRAGWREVPYLRCPASLADLASAGASVPFLDRQVRIVPGLAVHQNGRSDVLRGEETQILGALATGGAAPRHFLLPGTHSKWVRTQEMTVTDFATYPTGEMYAVLLRHTTLGQLAPPRGPEPLHAHPAFVAGLERARAPGDSLGKLFSVRAGALLGDFSPDALPAFLSGLLIGTEVSDGLERLDLSVDRGTPRVGLIGSAALGAAYAAALEARAVPYEVLGEETAAVGLSRLSQAMGMR